MRFSHWVWQTENPLTIAISGTGTGAMEATIANSVEPGDVVLVGVPGYFGDRLVDMAGRYGADIVKPTQPPTGGSTFADIRYAPLTGHYYRIDKGTPLPVGLAVIADGEDVGGTHSLTHHTIYPTLEMPFSEFVEKFMNCGWVYSGKKQVI